VDLSRTPSLLHWPSPVRCGSSRLPIHPAGHGPAAKHRLNVECGQSAGVTDETVFYRIEVNIVEMHGEVVIVPDRVLLMAALPNRTFAATGHHREPGSALGKDFTKASLIARQRPGKSAAPWGSVHRQCMWSGRTTQPSI